MRSFDFYKYWILSARELERVHLSPVQTVIRGKSFADGKPVKVDGETYKLRCSWKHMTVEKVSYGIIIVFAIVYILAIVV